MVNPVLAPRKPKCRACNHVASIEDVTIRLYDPDLNPLPLAGAVEYLRTVGMDGTNRQLRAIALVHRRHVDKFIERGGAVAPAELKDGVSRIPPPVGNTRWVDVNQQGMDVGSTALQQIGERMKTGGMEDKDLIAVAKIGQGAATVRATLEMKGALKRAEAIARLASGLSKPQESA